MKRLLRVLGWILGVLVVAWVGACAYLAMTHPRVTFTAEELARPASPLPKGFLWGTATSSHQLEGGNTNDWTRFEAQPGTIERGETSAVSADHWNRMAEDVALMKAIRANAYRFSIEWSRLESREGAWNEEDWARYSELVRLLREAKITPAVTLLHFALPLWMADRGGVTAPDFPERFGRFASEAGRRLGPGVDLWITLNERTCRCTWATSSAPGRHRRSRPRRPCGRSRACCAGTPPPRPPCGRPTPAPGSASRTT